MNKDYYWLNKDSRTFLSRGYLEEDVSAEERIRIIAQTAERILSESQVKGTTFKGFADKFEKYMARGFYSLATPVWTNFGNKRGYPVSCFGSYVPDTMEGILGKVAEVGIMSKNGGGTSAYFGDLRARGSKITAGGESSGPVHFMELFDTVADVVSQGSARRGSFAGYLSVDHPDIEEFLQIKGDGHAIQNMSIGITITDDWMNSMIEGDKTKRKTWGLIIKKRFESGYPYIFFTDTINNSAPKAYKDKGKVIRASNLCVTGDTLIEILIDDTEKLFIQIKDLEFYRQKYKNIKVKSYDIIKKEMIFSEILDFAQTGESTELIEIQDELGNVLKCTPEHKIYTKNRGYVEAQDLKEEDILENCQVTV